MQITSRVFNNLALVIIALLVTACSTLLYYPSDLMYVEEDSMNPKPTEWAFKSRDGQDLYGWYFTSPKPTKGVIILFHGNGENRSSHFASLYWAVDEGYDLFVFDYPGYGKSYGKPTPQSTVDAGVGALIALHEKKPKLPMIVYGHSLGGAVAMRAVYETRGIVHPRLLVVSSSFISYRKAVQKVLAHHWGTWLFQPVALGFSDKWSPKKVIKELGVPLVVIHSKDDEIIPFSLGEDVYREAAEPKEFWPIEKATHNHVLDLKYGLDLRTRLLGKWQSVVSDN
ncbi:MAG: alpha/beta fold hydrolase [Bdellovibrionota bacterium]